MPRRWLSTMRSRETFKGYTSAMTQPLSIVHLPPARPPTDVEVRGVILAAEEELKGLPTARTRDEVPLEHFFAEGTYTRKITMPAGMMCTGAIHKYDTMNIVTRGRCRVLTETEGVLNIVGPAYFIGPKCTKRLLYILEETVWCSIHPNPEGITDEELIRKAIAWETYEEIPEELRKELL